MKLSSDYTKDKRKTKKASILDISCFIFFDGNESEQKVFPVTWHCLTSTWSERKKVRMKSFIYEFH